MDDHRRSRADSRALRRKRSGCLKLDAGPAERLRGWHGYRRERRQPQQSGFELAGRYTGLGAFADIAGYSCVGHCPIGDTGWAILPSSFTYSISASTGTVNYSISGVPTWLTASVTSGTATTSGSTITFAPNANANVLPVGMQTATITFTNKDTGVGTQTRTATATVTPAQPTTIFAAVAPNARTTTIGVAVTAFASIVNAGSNPAIACSIALPNGVPATFFYQTTDPTTNNPTGTGNTPANIAPGNVQTFYFAVTPTQLMSQDIRLVFSCSNASPAPVFQGLNTFLLTATSSPVADMLSIAQTLSRDGNMVIPGSTGTGVIATASIESKHRLQ